MASETHEESDEDPHRATIPLIDFSPFLFPKSPNSPSPSQTATANQLVSALHTTGFAYITNHGIPPDLLDQVFTHSKRFFRLGIAEKMLAPHPPGDAGVHRGYSHPGLEKVSQHISSDDDDEIEEELRETRDAKESFEIGSEDFAEQPNFWPPETLLPGWREFMLDFYWSCHLLAVEVLRAVAIGLGLKAAEAERFLRVHSGLNDQLRLLHYPSIPAREIESGGAERMPAHSDWSCITMLFQDDCGGLEVEDACAPGRFVPATPVDGAVVVNVGDLLMRWSNGVYTLEASGKTALLTPGQVISYLPCIALRFHRWRTASRAPRE